MDVKQIILLVILYSVFIRINPSFALPVDEIILNESDSIDYQDLWAVKVNLTADTTYAFRLSVTDNETCDLILVNASYYSLNIPYPQYLRYWGLFGIIVAIWLAGSHPEPEPQEPREMETPDLLDFAQNEVPDSLLLGNDEVDGQHEKEVHSPGI